MSDESIGPAKELQSGRFYRISAGKDFLRPSVDVIEVTADKLIEQLRQFRIIDMPAAEYAELSNIGLEGSESRKEALRKKAAAKKKSGFFIGGEGGGSKRRADWKFSSLATLDLDDLTPETAAQSIQALRDVGAHAVIYSTASHTPAKPRLRAVVFLAGNVTPNNYRNIIQWLANRLPPRAVSSESFKPVQIMYRPQRCSDGEEVFIEIPGNPLVIEPILDAADAVPVIARKSKVTPAWDKPGIIGAVGRRYRDDLDAAIDELGIENVPYTRSTAGPTCGIGEQRYTRVGTSGVDGAIWHANDGHMFSYHGASDPGAGQQCTIFDIARLARFANPKKPEENLDKDCDANTPLHRRPSHAACEKWFYDRLPELREVVQKERARTALEGIEDLGPPTPFELPVKSRFEVVPIDVFCEGPEPSWIVEGVIPRSELAIIYGAPGCGKSFFTLDLALAVARGVPWRNFQTERGPIVYICAESASGFRSRLKAYAQQHNISLSDLHDWFGLIGNAPNLLNIADVDELCRQLIALRPLSMVVIDTLARVTPGANENAAEDMGRALSHCKRIHEATEALVVLVHHSGKDSAKGARGWSGIRAAADLEIEIVRLTNMRRAKITKQRDGEDNVIFEFDLISVSFGVDSVKGRVLSSLVVEHMDTKPESVSAKPPRAKIQRAVWDALHALGGSSQREKLTDLATDQLVCTPNSKRDQRRNHVKTAIDALVNRQVIEINNDTARFAGAIDGGIPGGFDTRRPAI